MDVDDMTEPEIPAARPDPELDDLRGAIRFGPEQALGGFDLESVLADLARVRSRARGPVDAVALVREGRQELEQRGVANDRL
jgi:hypothetical protein